MLSPNIGSGHYALGLAYLQNGNYSDAVKEFQKEVSDEEKTQGLAMAYFSLGKKEQFEAALSQFIESWGKSSPAMAAEIYAWSGKADDAFKWLDTAINVNDKQINSYEGIFSPLLARFSGDKRWELFLSKLDPHVTKPRAINFNAKLPL